MSTKVINQSYTNQLLETASPESFSGLKTEREAAWKEFGQSGLPENKSEEYKFTPVSRMLARHFAADELFKPTATSSSHNVKDSLLNLFEDQVVFINGKFSPSASHISPKTKLIIQPLREALNNHPDLVRSLLDKPYKQGDPFALLNDAFWQDGLFILVPKNTEVKDPVILYHHHDAHNEKIATHTRLFVLVEENAALTIIEKTNSQGQHPVFNTINERIVVKQNASFTYCKIQNDSRQLIQVSNTLIHQENSSRTDTFTFTLDGTMIRNNLNILIDGEGCDSHFYGLYLTQGDTLMDNHTVVDHQRPNSFSNELYKGLMDGNSKGVFNGKIFVRPHAQKTNAFQSNRNILLSDTATINTKPQLEIWADDVKCSHGCTTGQLDEEALFYLQSRGIPKSTAKAMLLYAFAGEVLEAVKDEKLRNYLDHIVSERLHKNF